MWFQLAAFLALGASLSSAGLTEQAIKARGNPNARDLSEHTSPRPITTFYPKTPKVAPPVHAVRTQVCYVQSHGNGSDDANYILDAINTCNNGGHVVFKEGATYTIGTKLNLTFLEHIDIDIQGYIQFTNDTTYWQENSFPLNYQNTTSFWLWGGNDVNIYGGGTIDGNGQVWYDLYASDIYIYRPLLIGIASLFNSTMRDVNLRYSPNYYYFVANSSNVVFDNITIGGLSSDSNTAKNTDGWDTFRSSAITIQNSVINNGDDCVSFKPNSTDMLVQNLYCNGSHGISVGSLGQYAGEYDIVEDLYIYNTSMYNAGAGARIKVWPDTASALSGDLQGGGGDGRVNNITYDTFYVDNVDYAIQVDQCYGQKNTTLCNEYPSPLTIRNVLFTNFTGTTSKKYEPLIGSIACSSTAACSNITATNIDVLTPKGTKDEAYCSKVDDDLLDLVCESDS